MYKILVPLYPIWKTHFPKHVCTLEDLGLSMINTTVHGYDKRILESWI